MYKIMQAVVIFLLVFSATASAQRDAFMGTWKLNVAKSKYNPGPAPKSTITKREPSGANGVKYTTDTVTAQGVTRHIEYTANYDGKDYPVKGDPNREMTSLKIVDSHTYEGNSKKAGKITSTFHVVVSADGKTMTTTTKGTNEKGQPENDVLVYDKM